ITITIAAGGAVAGGNGGEAGDTFQSPGVHAQPGAGGAGIVGADLTIFDRGVIQGGANGTGGVFAEAGAIDFIGGVNSLILAGGYQLFGAVVAYSALDSLVLGGSDNGIFQFFDQFQGFGIFQVNTTAATTEWDLHSATTADIGWTIINGVLGVLI